MTILINGKEIAQDLLEIDSPQKSIEFSVDGKLYFNLLKQDFEHLFIHP